MIISYMKRVTSPGSMHDSGCLGLVHWDDLGGMVWGGKRKEGSGWGTHVYLWQIHFDVWQNQFNIVKLKQNKTKQKQLGELAAKSEGPKVIPQLCLRKKR